MCLLTMVCNLSYLGNTKFRSFFLVVHNEILSEAEHNLVFSTCIKLPGYFFGYFT